MSILSNAPDGMGYFYGFHEDDTRQINARLEPIPNRDGQAWFAYVGGEPIEGYWNTKDAAESAAIAWIKANPE